MNALAVELDQGGGPEIVVPAVLVDVDESRELGTLVLEDRSIVVRDLRRVRVLDVRYSDGRDVPSLLAIAASEVAARSVADTVCHAVFRGPVLGPDRDDECLLERGHEGDHVGLPF